MKVIELSRQGRVTPHVVRFYVRKGLLSPDRHPHNGYRVFGRDHLSRIELIRSLQTLGFTLAEIAKALEDVEAGHSPFDWMRGVLEARILETECEQRALQRKRERMTDALARWPCTADMRQGRNPSLEELVNDVNHVRGSGA